MNIYFIQQFYSMSKVTFNNKNNEFYQSLKTSVDEYFATNKLKRTGDWRLFSKTIILVGLALLIYGSLMLVNMPGIVAALLCALLGYTMACVGFSVMHDANHGSYSTNSTLNDALGLTLNFMGASSYFWKQKHNIIHHTYTNVDGVDDDIAKSPIIRQCESQKWVPAHRIQHLYLPFVYSLSTIFWIYIMDFAEEPCYFLGNQDLLCDFLYSYPDTRLGMAGLADRLFCNEYCNGVNPVAGIPVGARSGEYRV